MQEKNGPQTLIPRILNQHAIHIIDGQAVNAAVKLKISVRAIEISMQYVSEVTSITQV